MKEKTKTKMLKSSNAKHKATIIALSIALGLAGTAAIVAPIVVSMNKKTDGGSTPTSTFTVTFDAQGGTFAHFSGTQSVVSGQKATYPENPTKSGGTFVGWYTEAACTTAFDFNTEITADKTLYAKYNDVPVVEYKTITYHAGDHGSFASGSTTTATIEAGNEFQSVSPTSTFTPNDGYVFTGWYNEDLSEEISPTLAVSDNLDVYAKCRESSNEVTLSFYTNGQDGETIWGDASKTVTKNTTWADISNAVPTVKKTNYAFDHWTLDKTTEQEISEDYKFTANAILYPVFYESPETRTIHYMLLDGQEIASGDESEEINCGQSGKLWSKIAKPTIVEGNKSFAGWYDADPTGHEEDEDWKGEHNITDSTTIYGDLTEEFQVYAMFITPDFSPTITFEVDTTTYSGARIVGVSEVRLPSATSGTGTQWQYVDKPYAVWPNTTNPGSYKYGYNTDYYVDYWEGKTASEATFTQIADDKEITEDMTVRPHFKEKAAVNFVKTDGTTAISSTKIVLTDKWCDIAKPDSTAIDVPTGYRFVYWEVKKDDDTWVRISNDNATIQEIFASIGEVGSAHPVRPHLSNDFWQVDFQTTGVDTTGATVTDISYQGVTDCAVEKSEAQWRYFNKPVAKHTKTEGSTTYEDYSFVKWQYSTDSGANWSDVYSDTPIGQNIIVQPVMEKKITITYSIPSPAQPEVATETEILTTSSTRFGEMYAPNIVDVEEGYVFSHWSLKGPGEASRPAITSDTTFSEDTTVYAVFRSDAKSTKIIYKVKPQDESAGATIIGNSEVTLNYPADNVPKFSAFGKGQGDWLGYEPTGKWFKGTEDTVLEEYWDDDETVPAGITYAYMEFEADESFVEVKVVDTDPTVTPQYDILNDQVTYWNANETPTFPLSAFPTKVRSRTPGYKPIGWQQYVEGTGWTDVTAETEMRGNMTLRPKWQANATAEVKFTKGKWPGCDQVEKVVDIPYSTKLVDYLKDSTTGDWKFKPNLTDHTFKGWQVVKGSGSSATYESITNDMYAEADQIVLGPKFIGRSEFENGDKPYYLDSEQDQWAQIVDSTDPTYLTVIYAGTGGIKSKITKADFNEEIYWGKSCTTVDPYFLAGCSSWNNGFKGGEGEEERPLTMPNGGSDITFGKSFLYGCSSFNQKIEFESNVTGINCEENFMRQCSSFNQDIDFAPSGYQGCIWIADGFMFDCISFTSTISVPYEFWPTDSGRAYNHVWMLATSDQYAPMARVGFKVKPVINPDLTDPTEIETAKASIYNTMNGWLPSDEASPEGPTYRKHTRTA